MKTEFSRRISGALFSLDELVDDLESILTGFNFAIELAEKEDPGIFKKIRYRLRVEV